MTSSVPQGQIDADDWFDLDKYRQAAGVAYEFSKKKMEESGAQERETIGKGATEQRTSAEQSQQFKQRMRVPFGLVGNDAPHERAMFQF